MKHGLDALTEKEKEALRLFVRGHDAKSMARELGRSVHTINDRLRAARRKLSVTSSREAARLLLEAEGPETLGHKDFGGADGPDRGDSSTPSNGRSSGARPAAPWRGRMIGGVLAMSMILALALAATIPAQHASSDSAPQSPPEQIATDHATEAAARDWLRLVDRSDWQASYDAAGSQFQEPNTVASWQSASELARGPLGDVLSREAIGYQAVNAPPHGYRMVEFRSVFAQREGVIETVTLEREEGNWRVVGYLIE